MMVEEQMLKLISETGPVTYLDVVELLGLKLTSANERLSRLHKAGILHISGWRYGSRRYMAMFDIGLTNDAPKPDKKPRAESRKEWEQRKKQQGVWHIYLKRYDANRRRKMKDDAETYLNRKRARKTIYSTNLVKKDPLLAALMGVKS